MDSLRCFLDRSSDEWDEHVSAVSGAIRSAVNRHTGYTPNRMMLGREVNIPTTLVLGPPVDEAEKSSPEDFVSKMTQNLSLAHEVARERLKTAQKVIKRDYDVRTRVKTFKQGDLVYYLNSSLGSRSKKLRPPWAGPGVIVKVISNCTYAVKTSKLVKVMHHDRLMVCNDRLVPKWARTLQQELLTQQEDNSGPRTESKQPIKSEGNGGKTGNTSPTPPPQKKGKKGKLYCLCRKPYRRSDGGMVRCDWFHFSCVGQTEKSVKDIDIYTCPGCEPVGGPGRPTSGC